MFAQRLALPFLVLALLFFGLAWKFEQAEYSWWMPPFLVVAAVIYVLAPQINWWWYTRNPPEMDPPLRALLERYHPLYKRLSRADQQKFRHRLALYTMGTDWMPVAFPDESLPADIQMIIGAQAVSLTLHQPEFLFTKFEKVIVYPQPFPTEEHQYAHASELYEPDGCLLFSAEQVMQAFLEPARWYNVALHEYARAFVRTYPDESYPAFDKADAWARLEKVSHLTHQHIEAIIGIEGPDPLAVAIHHYIVFADRFRDVFPDEATALDRIFHYEPAPGLQLFSA